MKNRKRNRKGATAVEFAIVAPVIFLMVLGLMEWARCEMIRQVSSTAAFTAARMGTMPGATEAEMEQHVDAVLGVYRITPSSRVATITADEASITMDIPMATNSWFLRSYFGNVTIQRNFTLNF